jgi:hypothetical protein
MKLNGWVRIGIVASLLWMFAVMSLAAYEFRAHHTSQSTLIAWKAKTGEDYAQVRKSTGQFADLVPLHAALAPRFFAYFILPVLCGWTAAFIGVYTSLWIIAGFRKKTGESVRRRI